MKTVNIFKINSLRKTVELATMHDSLTGIYVALECDMFIPSIRLPNEDQLLIDENGLTRLRKTPPNGFIIDGGSKGPRFFWPGDHCKARSRFWVPFERQIHSEVYSEFGAISRPGRSEQVLSTIQWTTSH